ncbi:MAG: hypothetical protein Q4Q53_04850 [Methanocorpusculum sp.]|nr:hypothetical protein [Methanocorpusculum sp.]
MEDRKHFIRLAVGWILVLSVLVIIVEAALFAFAGSYYEEQMIKAQTNYKFIEGTWVTEDYTSPAGVHYTKKVDTYNDKGAFNETLYLDDGSTLNLKGMLIYNRDNSFTSYYSSLILLLNSNNDIVKLTYSDFDIKDMVFNHTVKGDNITGVWTNAEPYGFQNGYDYIEISANDDGTGLLNFISDTGNKIPMTLEWTKLGKNSFVFTISEPMTIVNIGDGKLHDTLGHAYTRVE